MSVLKRGMPQNPKDPSLIPPTLHHISYDERRARSRVTAHQISPLLGNVTLRRPHIVSYPPVVCPLRNKSCDNSTPSSTVAYGMGYADCDTARSGLISGRIIAYRP